VNEHLAEVLKSLIEAGHPDAGVTVPGVVTSSDTTLSLTDDSPAPPGRPGTPAPGRSDYDWMRRG
jgi:hypothetical protein